MVHIVSYYGEFWSKPLYIPPLCSTTYHVSNFVLNLKSFNSIAFSLAITPPTLFNFYFGYGLSRACTLVRIFSKMYRNFVFNYSFSLSSVFGVNLVTRLKHSHAQFSRKMESLRELSSFSWVFFCRASSSSFRTLASSTRCVSSMQSSISLTLHRRQKASWSFSATRTIYDWLSWCWWFSCASSYASYRWW